MAEHHVAHVFAIHASARQRFAHDQRGQFCGGGVLQAAAVGTDGGTHAADNNNFSAHLRKGWRDWFIRTGQHCASEGFRL
jgi:hypothetical protein